MTKLAFLDLETTGLDPRQHDIWEIGVIVRDPELGEDEEFLWQIRPDLDKADPKALEIGRFHERFQVPNDDDSPLRIAGISIDEDGPQWRYQSASEVFIEVQDALLGTHIVGAVPSFDDAFLKAAFHPRSLRIGWHHRLICAETLVAGALRQPIPEGLGRAAEAMGVVVDETVAHTALGDVRLARDVYDAVMGGASHG